MKKVLVLGCDGYIGNALTQRLLAENYEVIGVDNFHKRKLVENEMNSFSAVKTNLMKTNINLFKRFFPGNFKFYNLDIANDSSEFDAIIELHKPDTIVNLAHNPSSPFSMKSQDAANYVLLNNIIGTNNLLWSVNRHCKDCHLVVLGTTGEYDHYNNIDIEEGYFSIEYNGRKSNEMIYPRRPGSVYHTSKVANTYLVDFLSKTWDLRCTDIMQSVVFGLYTPEIEKSKIYSPLHTDEAFGTVINRFIVQAKLKEPLTVYGKGDHQRGFLSLNDSIQALMIAIENPAEKGRPRVWNQLSEWHSINDIAKMVKDSIDTEIEISHIESPRKEQTTEHYYNYKTDILKSLGYSPTRTIEEEIKYVFNVLDEKYIKKLKDVIKPKIIFTESK